MTTETFEYNGKTHTLTVDDDGEYMTYYTCHDFPDFEFRYYKGDHDDPNVGWECTCNGFFDEITSGPCPTISEVLDDLFEIASEYVAFCSQIQAKLKPNKAD